MSDFDPGRLPPPVPKGWNMISRDGAGIVLPYFTRKLDGLAVKFSTELAAWAAFSRTGEQLKELGTSHTPGGMMAHVDASMPASVGSSDGPEFNALFRSLLMQGLFTVKFLDGAGVSMEITEKGLAALAILECVKA